MAFLTRTDTAKHPPRPETISNERAMDMTDYRKFWRGEFSLGQAFWIMYFGINCALGFAVLLLMFVIHFFQIQSLVTIIYFGGAIIIAAYTLWAAVGMWRCSPLRGKDGFLWAASPSRGRQRQHSD